MEPPFLPRSPVTTVSAIDLVLGKLAYNVGLASPSCSVTKSDRQAVNGAPLVGAMNAGD